jgi:hypothetical protein
MSSRWARGLLRLYPRRIRERYGQELLDLQDELRARGELSRARLVRDTIVGAALSRSTRRRAALGAALLAAALALAIGLAPWGHTTRAVRALPVAQLAARSPAPLPHQTCPVDGGGSCSAVGCAELVTSSAPTLTTTVSRATHTTRPQRRVAAPRCLTTTPDLHPHALSVATATTTAVHPRR